MTKFCLLSLTLLLEHRTTDTAQLIHNQGAQCSYFVPMCQPFFFFLLTFLGRSQDLFPYLFLDLFFLYFFSWVEDKKVYVLAKHLLGGVGCSFPGLDGSYPSQDSWRGLHCGSKLSKMQGLHGPPGSVARDTRNKPANPRLFLFVPVQVEKKRAFASGSRNGTPPWVYFHLKPASGGSQQQLPWTNAEHVPELGTLSHPATSSAPPEPSPSPRASGTASCRPFSSPQCYLHVPYFKLWTGNVTVFMLLDSERKSLSCRPLTLGSSPNSDVPHHNTFPKTNICSCHNHCLLSGNVFWSPASSVLILQSCLHSTKWFLFLKKEKIIFSNKVTPTPSHHSPVDLVHSGASSL